MIQSGLFLGRFVGPLLITGLNHKKLLRSWTTTLIISNDGMKDIIKVVKSLEDSCLLLKGVREAIENE